MSCNEQDTKKYEGLALERLSGYRTFRCSGYLSSTAGNHRG